jgi:hypothetical protein
MKYLFLSSQLFLSAFTAFAQTEVPFDSVGITCLYLIHAKEKYIINSNHDYDKLLEIRALNSDCADYALPPIDFQTKTLIGYLTSSGGCDPPKFSKSIKKSGNGEYKITVRISPHGACRKKFMNMHWFLVDKIDERIKLTFESSFTVN